jgi:hypothetical protein
VPDVSCRLRHMLLFPKPWGWLRAPSQQAEPRTQTVPGQPCPGAGDLHAPHPAQPPQITPKHPPC